ncbi:MAG: hypothetical protein COY19_04525 [Candidatus Marinimicrobia bacterium CG_4_10_14_0_2_um_filter_48_9]|nr:MAG: hypothetical protein COY19_04525 [Candidatus Marinimicrobia bacterium CG_4_10_14_0_2_um_filter_48_9]
MPDQILPTVANISNHRFLSKVEVCFSGQKNALISWKQQGRIAQYDGFQERDNISQWHYDLDARSSSKTNDALRRKRRGILSMRFRKASLSEIIVPLN